MEYDFTSPSQASGETSNDSGKLRDGGTYIMIAESLEAKPTKAGTGVYIAAKFQVVDGACDGKTIWGNFNIQNPSATAERIGKEAMAKLAEAVGEDPKKCKLANLRYIPFLGTLKVRRDTPDEVRFEVVKFTELEQAEKERVAAKWTSSQNLDDGVETPF